jgi:hypothetical protein
MLHANTLEYLITDIDAHLNVLADIGKTGTREYQLLLHSTIVLGHLLKSNGKVATSPQVIDIPSELNSADTSRKPL